MRKGYCNSWKNTDLHQTQLVDAMLLENVTQCLGGALMPNSYTIFESILHDIFPWAITFSNSKTTDNNLKVVLTRPDINVTEGVQIPNWKEITFFLPLNTSNATENEICHFPVNIMGNKVDYEELPRIIFQPNIFKNALQMILRTTDELQVCPRINDPKLLDYAERKGLKLLYQVDYHKSISDKKIVKCIRSTKCSYILPKDSRVRCHECQGFLWSHRHLLKQSCPERTQCSTAHDSHANLSTLTRAELITRAKKLHEMVAQTQKRAKRYYLLYHREKQNKLKHQKITALHPLN